MKKIILGIMIGIILGSGLVYGANIYESNSIEYSPRDASWEVSNVSEAINSLHNTVTELETIKTIGDATASDISDGKTAVVQGKEVIGTSKPLNLITKDIAYFSGTTNASGVITKRIYAADLGMSRIIGLTKGSVEEYIKTAGHFLSIAPSADGTYADLTCYMSYGGQTVKCGATIIGVAN